MAIFVNSIAGNITKDLTKDSHWQSSHWQSAIAKLGNIIEWDRSYLTNEGTYCVYRADSPETLREHGALAGAPIGKITSVNQQAH